MSTTSKTVSGRRKSKKNLEAEKNEGKYSLWTLHFKIPLKYFANVFTKY